MIEHDFFRKGWCRFGYDPVLASWGRKVLDAARTAVEAPENRKWLRHGGTWFAGVNVLPNDESGAVDGSTPLSGEAVDFIAESLGLRGFAWDRAQISVVYPGYPRRDPGESAAAARYRREHDASHLDGLLPEGPRRRRHLREHHAFILGIPLVETSVDASPLVMWESSHEILRKVFKERFQGLAPDTWGEIDSTEIYHTARRRIFDTCARVAVTAKPGEAYLIHRLALHGVAPWGADAWAPREGRMILYFRPHLKEPRRWLEMP